jgi:hypothetical protein
MNVNCATESAYMSMSTEQFMEVMGVLSRMNMRASSVWVSQLAIQAAIQKLSDTPWYEPGERSP